MYNPHAKLQLQNRKVLVGWLAFFDLLICTASELTSLVSSVFVVWYVGYDSPPRSVNNGCALIQDGNDRLGAVCFLLGYICMYSV